MFENLEVCHIVAMASNRVIGREGGMPWHIPEDFKFFKATTMGHAIVMGRKTWESIGRALPGRQTIVVSRATSDRLGLPGGVIHTQSLEAGFEWCQEHRETWGDRVFVVGGGELYRLSMPYVDKIFLTEIERDAEGDTTYPEVEGFTLVSRDERLHDDTHFAFCLYQRNAR